MATKTTQQPAATTTLQVPSEFPPEAVTELSKAINGVLADTLALYLKAKNFHWHVSGPHFRDYHLLFEEQATQLLGATDDMAERVRKIGGATLKSIGHIAKLQRISSVRQF
jgi:starvation-inducible DNA-binding protein